MTRHYTAQLADREHKTILAAATLVTHLVYPAELEAAPRLLKDVPARKRELRNDH